MRAPPHRNPDFEKGRGRWLPSWWRPPAAGAPVAPSQSSWSSSGPASVCRGGAAAPPALIIPFVVRQDPPRRQMPPSTGQAADDRPLAGEKGVLRILLPNRVCCELERQRCQRRGATERGGWGGGTPPAPPTGRWHHPMGGVCAVAVRLRSPLRGPGNQRMHWLRGCSGLKPRHWTLILPKTKNHPQFTTLICTWLGCLNHAPGPPSDPRSCGGAQRSVSDCAMSIAFQSHIGL